MRADHRPSLLKAAESCSSFAVQKHSDPAVLEESEEDVLIQEWTGPGDEQRDIFFHNLNSVLTEPERPYSSEAFASLMDC